MSSIKIAVLHYHVESVLVFQVIRKRQTSRHVGHSPGLMATSFCVEWGIKMLLNVLRMEGLYKLSEQDVFVFFYFLIYGVRNL